MIDATPEARSDAQTGLVGLAAGSPWEACDGALSLEDAPQTAIEAVVLGHKLRPVAQVVRGSILGRSIAFDFAEFDDWQPERPCYIGEARLAAGFKRTSPAYRERLELAPGQYRLGEGWQAYFSHPSAEGGRRVHRPEFYGVLVLDAAAGLDRRPQRMFTPTGRVSGRVAICFKDRHRSWIAGAFEMPACGDQPQPDGQAAGSRVPGLLID